MSTHARAQLVWTSCVSSGLLVFRLDFLCFVWTSCVSSGLLVFGLDLCVLSDTGGSPLQTDKTFRGLCRRKWDLCLRSPRQARVERQSDVPAFTSTSGRRRSRATIRTCTGSQFGCGRPCPCRRPCFRGCRTGTRCPYPSAR